ncbi:MULTISPECIES: PTS sugar transporter subunit IIA [Clostridium]|uniref:PTS sugar transporter subunit IIA n=1 Tax=Clostridium TaxID=1485 RepID=UPI00189E871C|nr:MULTISPECIES: PTS glucose transporter subunit IIA [Clostridium]MDB2076597.1 PTS glucose transporter subunit IIA [Clostridium paraputrificum]MDB2079570.1 PTS glucose transporter subunit IIA [Clostridium paraputrificum]MDB2117429.1 PTS glucose transporter subunit IIA [Clostridium paraputrificum]MDU1033356.1 PTS glucose transporter subunit IIA [Clostridium sp.]MDU3411633.1 PTS glucose transporter subunit IIA [Clostridium sp.]
MKIYSPCLGVVKHLENVNDVAFAQKLIGDGIAVVPKEGNIVSPIDGEVAMVFPTGHAIGLKTDEGVEILIHVGIDTVELDGKGFKAFVKQGDKVKVGDKLLKVNLEEVINEGYEVDTMVLVTDIANYKKVVQVPEEKVSESDLIFNLE